MTTTEKRFTLPIETQRAKLTQAIAEHERLLARLDRPTPFPEFNDHELIAIYRRQLAALRARLAAI